MDIGAPFINAVYMYFGYVISGPLIYRMGMSAPVLTMQTKDVRCEADVHCLMSKSMEEGVDGVHVGQRFLLGTYKVLFIYTVHVL